MQPRRRIGEDVEIETILGWFGKELSDFPPWVHVTPFLYYILYTFLLRQMLLDQNLEALSFFAAHRDALAGRLGPAQVPRLSDLLDALEFEDAAGLIPQSSAV